MNRREALLALNVNQNSSQEEVKSAYRKMALELHQIKIKEKTRMSNLKKLLKLIIF